MVLNRGKLRQWVSRRTLSPPIASRFAVFHIARHGDALIVSVGSAGSQDDWASTVERVVTDETADHVEAWPGRQQYVVRAYSDGNEESVGEFPFALAANAGAGGETVALLAAQTPDHDAAMIGQIPLQDFGHPHAMVMGQQMRHNESLMRCCVDLAMSSRERDGQIIARQQHQIDKMADERHKLLDAAEQMYSRKQERELVQNSWDEDKSRKDAMLSRVLEMVLPEMARSAGLSLSGDVADEIKKLFLKLPEDVQSKVVSSLPKEDGKRLLDLFEGKTETQH